MSQGRERLKVKRKERQVCLFLNFYCPHYHPAPHAQSCEVKQEVVGLDMPEKLARVQSPNLVLTWSVWEIFKAVSLAPRPENQQVLILSQEAGDLIPFYFSKVF